jgi:hypothetical protein
MATPTFVGDGNDDGEVLGRASGKIGFFGLATPVAKRSGSSQAALTLTTATISGYGFSTSAAFTAFINQIEEIRASLVAYGLLTGS